MGAFKIAIKINPDRELVKLIREGLKNKDGYCPCMLNRNEDTKCICKAFRDMEEGVCPCGLFIKTKEEEVKEELEDTKKEDEK